MRGIRAGRNVMGMSSGMRCNRRRESECGRDAIADALCLVTCRIGTDVDAIKPARLTNPRFDLRAAKLVLRAYEKRLRIREAGKGTELDRVAAVDGSERRSVGIGRGQRHR